MVAGKKDEKKHFTYLSLSLNPLFLQLMAIDNKELECYLPISTDYAARYIVI